MQMVMTQAVPTTPVQQNTSYESNTSKDSSKTDFAKMLSEQIKSVQSKTQTNEVPNDNEQAMLLAMQMMMQNLSEASPTTEQSSAVLSEMLTEVVNLQQQTAKEEEKQINVNGFNLTLVDTEEVGKIIPITEGENGEQALLSEGFEDGENKEFKLSDTTQVAQPISQTVLAQNVTQPTALTAEQVLKDEYLQEIKSQITTNIASGNYDFEIQLEPQNIGKLIIKTTYEAGKAIVSIICTDPETMQIMAKSAGDLAAIIENRSGQYTQVIVENPAEDYLQNFGEQNKQNNDNAQNQNQGEKDNDEHAVDFLQQLRLGLA